MTERNQDPGPDDADDGLDDEEGPQEIVDAAYDELSTPADESDEG